MVQASGPNAVVKEFVWWPFRRQPIANKKGPKFILGNKIKTLRT